MQIDSQISTQGPLIAASALKKVAGEDGLFPASDLRRPSAGQKQPADSAASNTSFPTSSPVALDASSLMFLQEDQPEAAADGAENKEAKGSKAVDDFLAYMEKTPAERLREDILKALSLTEEDLEGMPPEQRKGIEKKIAEIIKERLTGGDAQSPTQSQDVEQLKATLQVRSTQTAELNDLLA